MNILIGIVLFSVLSFLAVLPCKIIAERNRCGIDPIEWYVPGWNFYRMSRIGGFPRWYYFVWILIILAFSAGIAAGVSGDNIQMVFMGAMAVMMAISMFYGIRWTWRIGKMTCISPKIFSAVLVGLPFIYGILQGFEVAFTAEPAVNIVFNLLLWVFALVVALKTPMIPEPEKEFSLSAE